MRRHLHTLLGRLTVVAGMGGLLVTGGHPAAQTAFPGTQAGGQGLQPPPLRPEETAPRLFSSPSGDLFRVWEREDDPQTDRGAILIAAAKPHDRWETLLEIQPPEAGVSARNGDLAFGSSGDLAVVYRWWRDSPRSKQVRLARSADGGKTWSRTDIRVDESGKGFDPRVAWGAGKDLLVVWADERRANRLFDVYARRSPDGGATWESEQLLSRFSRNSPTDLYNQPQLLSDGRDRFWVVWTGVRNARSYVFLNRSTDGGRTWTDPVSLTGDSESVFGQRFLRAGDRMLLVWQDRHRDPDRLYAAASSDAGLTWTAPVRVDHLPAGLPSASSPTALLSADGEALVAWQDARNGREDIFLARSTDGGRTWTQEDQRMDMDDPGTAISRYPKLARAEDGRVAIAWEDDRDGYEAVYVRVRSAGPKPEWGPEVLAAPARGKLAARVPELAWGRDGLSLVWQVWDYTSWPGHVAKHIDGRTLRLDTR